MSGDKPRLILLWTISIGVVVLIAYAALQGPQIQVQWKTESELDIVGFNIYRSDAPDGSFVKVNNDIMAPSVDPLLGGEHFFVDGDVQWFRTYYYKLESVDRSGMADRSDPIALRAGPSLLFPK